MPCKAPAFKRDPNCPGPAGLPANLRCQRCARGLCEAPGEKFSQNCGGPDGKPPQIVCPICMRKRQFSTHDQVTQLVATNHMSHGVAHSFKAVMSVMAKYRFRLHLDREGEKDFVFTKPGKARWGARDPQREEPCFAHGGGKGATHTAHGRYPDDARGSERPDRRNPKPRFHHGARANVREREGEGPGEARKSFRVTEGGSCDRTGRFTLGVNLEVGS